MEERMTEKSQEVEDIQEDQDVQETEEVQEVQDVPEAEEAQDVQDDEPQMPDEEQPDVSQPDQEITTTVESVVEAVLFASDESLTDARLANIVETSAKQIRQHIKNLNNKYQANNNAFRIEQIASGYQMLTLSPYNHWLKKLLRVRSDNKLSPAALETLAIIAYKQPVMRADIEAIRGVAVGEVIRSLSYKGLVKIVGRAEVLGRPMLYGTTKKFLEVFGLNTLKDLPKAQELKEPSL
jgi:segregation and condensation protein B